MKNKELAEKVAEKLGFNKFSGGYMWWSHAMEGNEGVEIFSWQTFGLMVEKAESMDFILHLTSHARFRDEPKVRVVKKQDGFHPQKIYETKAFSVKEHGHIKACALAFVEINMEDSE